MNRASHRSLRRLPTYWGVRGISPRGPFIGVVRDVTPRGAFVHVARSTALAGIDTCRLEVDIGGRRVEAEGFVRWAGKRDGDECYGLGISFSQAVTALEDWYADTWLGMQHRDDESPIQSEADLAGIFEHVSTGPFLLLPAVRAA